MPVFNKSRSNGSRPYPRMRVDDQLGASAPLWDIGAGPVNNYSVVSGYCPPQGIVRTMSDIVVPQFRRRSAEGEVFFNPMSSTRAEFTSNSDSGVVRQVTPAWAAGQTYRAGGDYLSYLLGGSSTPVSKIPEPVRLASLPVDAAVIEACTKAAARPSDASLLVTIAETQKTLRMLPGALHSWRGFLQRLNTVGPRNWDELGRNTLRQLKAHERMLTEFWLQARFGLRPLVMDTLGALKAVQRVYDDKLVRQTARGHATFSVSDVVSDFYGGLQQRSYTRTTRNEVSVRAMSLWEGGLYLGDQLGLSARNVPEAVIDLTRFSFVVNWLVNVNDFARSLGSAFDSGFRTLGGCHVVTVSNSTVWQFTGSDTTSDPTYEVASDASGIATAVREERWRVPGLKAPKLALRADPYRFLTDLRLLDAATLLSQQLRRRNVRVLAGMSAKAHF